MQIQHRRTRVNEAEQLTTRFRVKAKPGHAAEQDGSYGHNRKKKARDQQAA